MLSLVYSSIATSTFDDDDLAALLHQSRDANARNDVTGVLFHKNGYFLQLLEGPDAAVRDKMATIRRDDRHTKVTTLLEETTTERQFPEWTMAYAPTGETELAQVPGYRSTFADLEDEGAGELTTSLPALRELIRWFHRNPTRLG